MLLRKANVVDGALELLDAEGLDGLTMRKLGAALDVHAGALYRHYPSKEALLDAMADKLLEGVADEVPDGPWEEQLVALAGRYRAALLTHRDGARVVAGTFVNGPNTNAVGVAAVQALCSAGIPAERAGWIVFATMYYVLGHTIEEQAQRELADRGAGASTWSSDLQDDTPYTQARASVLAADPDERFAYGLQLFIDGIRHQLPPATSRRRLRKPSV